MKTFLLLCSLFAGVTGLWLIDIGQIGLSMEFSGLTNNFWTLHPGVVYHLGMYTNFFAIFMLGYLSLKGLNGG